MGRGRPTKGGGVFLAWPLERNQGIYLSGGTKELAKGQNNMEEPKKRTRSSAA